MVVSLFSYSVELLLHKKEIYYSFRYFFRVMYQNLIIEHLVNVLSIEWGDTRKLLMDFVRLLKETWVWWEGLEEIGRNRSMCVIYTLCFAVRLKSHIFCRSCVFIYGNTAGLVGKFGTLIWKLNMETLNSLEISKLELIRFHWSISQLVILDLTFPAYKKPRHFHPWGSPVVKISTTATTLPRPANAGGSASSDRSPLAKGTREAETVKQISNNGR